LPVIILALAAVLLFAVAMAWFLVASATRARQVEEIESQLLGLPFCALSLEQAFDPERAVIWETQIPALQMMVTAGRRGLPAERLYGFYQRSSEAYPELYDGSSFYNWLDFLERSRIVTWTSNKLVLTPEGGEFVDYLSSGKSLARFRG
jgi:hypothetical protein